MRRPWLIASLLLLAVVALALGWPSASYDPSRVHPSLRDLPKPYRSVRVDYYLDGGSVGVQIVAASGAIREFALPVAHEGNGPTAYPRLYVGGMHLPDRPGAPPLTEITDSPDTRAMLFRLIESGANHDSEAVTAMFRLRSAPVDRMRLVCFALRRRLGIL